MGSNPPSWLELLSPLPADARPRRKPVASAEQIEAGTAGPIAGWESVIVDLSAPAYGSRHVQITLDANGELLSGGDSVMFVRETAAHDDCIATVTDHESIGGRFEKDGSFLGTCWKTTLESSPAGDGVDAVTRSAEKRAPSDDEIATLRRIIGDVLTRRP
ncbi:MAG TPA: hypothetical protein VM096_20205 [Vicinamibacterales bacterium]|nr:hypothetical protein [Vicinamibacterales bacterium]